MIMGDGNGIRGTAMRKIGFMFVSLTACALGAAMGTMGGEPAAAPAAALPENTWVSVNVDFGRTLKEFLNDKKGGWSQSDGFSDSLYRSKTGTVIIRTGVDSKDLGYSPGFYTNASVEWDLAADTAKVLNVANWGGGSYGHGRLLPAFKEHPTPTPRHTYDGMAYVPEKDVMYMMLGANWRIGGTGADEEAKARLAVDNGLTWRYDFKTGRWSSVDHNVWKLFKCSPYESHLEYWPEGKKLIFLNDGGNQYAEFDLEKEQWEKVALAGKCPMSLYNARSDWDSKRGLWVFRLGERLCTFDPKTRSFEALPDCYKLDPPRDEKGRSKDPRAAMKGVCYISRHDRYLVCGPTGNDTAAYDPGKKAWTPIRGGDLELVNGYMKYNPDLDVVAMNYQLKCFKFRYAPAK